MSYNTEAIVIRSIPYGETHAIVTLLTPQGTVAAMARGAKKPQSRFAAAVQLCAQGVYTISQNGGMGNLNQCEVLHTYRALREQLDLAAYAAYFCELAGSVAEPRPQGLAVVYKWFVAALERLLAGREQPAVVARIWESKVAWLMGACPRWNRCVHCEGTFDSPPVYSVVEGGFLCETCAASVHRGQMLPTTRAVPEVLERFTRVPWERLGQVRLQDSTERQLRQILRYQLQDFGGLSLKSRTFVDQMDELWNE